MKEQRILLTGGGSGGHVTPVVALSKELLRRGYGHVNYIGSRSDDVAKDSFAAISEVRSSFTFGGKFRRFSSVSGWRLFKLWRHYLWNIRDIFLVCVGILQSLYIMLRSRPDIVFSKGGFPALPVCVAARILRIRLITHDSDAVSGLSHRLMGAYPHIRLFGVPLSQGQPGNWHYVGVPLSKKFLDRPKPERFKEFSKKDQMIFVTGGGNGSRELNRAVIDVANDVLGENPRAHIYVVAGDRYLEDAQQRAAAKVKREDQITVVGFTTKMYDLLSQATVVVTRAGATILAEAAALSKPSVIVPNPLLPGSHQIHNAAAYKDSAAALLVTDRGNSIDRSELHSALTSVLSNKKVRDELSDNIHKFATSNSTSLVADYIEAGLKK